MVMSTKSMRPASRSRSSAWALVDADAGEVGEGALAAGRADVGHRRDAERRLAFGEGGVGGQVALRPDEAVADEGAFERRERGGDVSHS